MSLKGLSTRKLTQNFGGRVFTQWSMGRGAPRYPPRGPSLNKGQYSMGNIVAIGAWKVSVHVLY